jgi:hypothetical protein
VLILHCGHTCCIRVQAIESSPTINWQAAGRYATRPFIETKESDMHWIDPKSLPATAGRVEQFLRNAEGEPNGMLLDGDIEIHFPPHLSAAVLKGVKIGDDVTIRGAKPRAADLVVAVALDTAAGIHMEDRGPKHGEHAPLRKNAWRKMELTGTVRRRLHGPKGDVNGALLDSGVILRFDVKVAPDLADVLAPGLTVTARGDGVDDALGVLLRVRHLGRAEGPLRAITKPGKPHRGDEETRTAPPA